MRMLAVMIFSLSMGVGMAMAGKAYVDALFAAAREPFAYVR
jgi:hypothetical protein